MLKRYQEEHKLDLPLSAVPYITLPCKPVLSANVNNINRPITASTAKLETSVYPGPVNVEKKMRPASSHSGFAISKRNYQPIIAQNNATRQSSIQINVPKPIEPSDISSIPDSKISNIKIKGSFDKLSSVFNLRQQLGFANTSNAELPLSKTGQLMQSSDDTRINSAKSVTNFQQSELIRIINSQQHIEDSSETHP